MSLRLSAGRIVINTAIVCASLGLAAGATEIFIRLFSPVRYHPLVPSAERGLFWQYDEHLGWLHRPGASGRFRKAGVFDTQVTINSRGFRGREHLDEAPPGVRRIVVLGDSIVWGYGVEDDEVFTSVLEREDAGLEWINLGVSGYGTDQESLLLEREGMRYKPDIVLAEVCENDFDENVHDQVYHIYPKPLFALRQGSLLLTNAPVPRVSLLDRLFYRLETGSYLWRLVNSYRISGRILDALKRCARGAGLSRSVPLPLSSPDQPEQLLVSLLGRTKRIAESNGARLALFIVAPMPQPHRALVSRFGEREGVAVIDLDPIFSRAVSDEGSSALFLRGDLHWTAEGHRVVARALEEWLEQSGALGSRRPSQRPPSQPGEPAVVRAPA